MYSEILFFTYISTCTTSIVSKHGKQTSKQLAVAVTASKYNGIAEIIEAESSPSMSNQFMMDYIKVKKLEKSLSRNQRDTSWLQRVVTGHASVKKTTNKNSNLIIDYVNTVKEAKKSLHGWSSKSGEKSETSKKWKKYISDRIKQKKLNVMLYKLARKTSGNKDHLSSHHLHQ